MSCRFGFSRNRRTRTKSTNASNWCATCSKANWESAAKVSLPTRAWTPMQKLRKILYRHGVTTAIDVRRMWQEEAVEGLRYPTWSLYEGRVDTMFHDEVGTLYCKCPQTGEVRQMSYYGLERKRATQKFHHRGVRCRAPVRCVKGVRNAIDSVALAKMQNGASYASGSTRTSFAPLRRLTRHTYRWKQLHKRRSALERINVRVGRDFQLERHYMRGFETMQMRIALSPSAMLE